jgi:hypothetical protein
VFDGSDASRASVADETRRLVVPLVVEVVDRVLQRSRRGMVVLGRHEDERIEGCDLGRFVRLSARLTLRAIIPRVYATHAFSALALLAERLRRYSSTPPYSTIAACRETAGTVTAVDRTPSYLATRAPRTPVTCARIESSGLRLASERGMGHPGGGPPDLHRRQDDIERPDDSRSEPRPRAAHQNRGPAGVTSSGARRT